jgi:hypothetical protein
MIITYEFDKGLVPIGAHIALSIYDPSKRFTELD